MKSTRSVLLLCVLLCVAVGCKKKDDDAKSKAPAAGKAKAAKPGAAVAPAAKNDPAAGVANGMAKLIDRMAAVAETHKGKCDDQSAALMAESKKMKPEIQKLAAEAKVLRAAKKLNLDTFKQAVAGPANAPTQRFVAAIEGCKGNGLALVDITIPIFKDDVPPPPAK